MKISRIVPILRARMSMLLMALLLSTLFAFSCQVQADPNGSATTITPILFLEIIFVTALLFAVFMLIERIFDRLNGRAPAAPAAFSSLISRLREQGFPRLVIIGTGVMLLCWLPYMICLYPGSMSNDTTGQISWVFAYFDQGENLFRDHHPIFTTWVFGGIVYAVHALTGHYWLGIFTIVLLQAVATAATFNFCLLLASRRWHAPGPVVAFSWIFLALFPLVPLLVLTISKDTFFSWLYVLYFAFLFDLLNSRYQPLQQGSWLKGLLVLAILCVLLSLTKKTGVYLVAATLAACAILGKTHLTTRLKLAAPALLSVLLMFCLMPALLAAHQIPKSPTKEALTFPIQQLARTYVAEKDALTEEDQRIFAQLFDVGSIGEDEEFYKIGNADKPKDRLKTKSARQFLGAYAQMGLKYPQDYWDAFIGHISYLVAPAKVSVLTNSSWHTWANSAPGAVPESFFEKPALQTQASEAIRRAYDGFLWRVPVIDIMLMQGFYAVFLPALLVVCLIRRRKRNRETLLFIVPVLLSVAMLVLSPITLPNGESMRYLVPFVYTAPFTLIIASLRPSQAICECP